MTYRLELTKPASISGSYHGMIDANISMYNFIANIPTNEITPSKLLNTIRDKLKDLGCTNLEVKASVPSNYKIHA